MLFEFASALIQSDPVHNLRPALNPARADHRGSATGNPRSTREAELAALLTCVSTWEIIAMSVKILVRGVVYGCLEA
jgi:hypothetical protein